MPRSAFLFSEPGCAIKKSRIMNETIQLPSIRIKAENPNHHLWNNHGTWFLHYTVHPTSFTKERIRRSLGTKDLAIARRRRDRLFCRTQRRRRRGLTLTQSPARQQGRVLHSMYDLLVRRAEGGQRSGQARLAVDHKVVGAKPQPSIHVHG